MNKYTVVTSASLPDLIEQVNEAIAEGWQPIGGVLVTQNERGEEFFQSMIK